MNWKSYQKYFKGKKILITGNSGFVGSYLSLTLSLFGSKILGYSLKKKDNRYLSNFSDYKRKIKTINDDIKNIVIRSIEKLADNIINIFNCMIKEKNNI